MKNYQNEFEKRNNNIMTEGMIFNFSFFRRGCRRRRDDKSRSRSSFDDECELDVFGSLM